MLDKERKRVLVLGAGHVSGPLVEYLSRDKSIQIVLASAIIEEAERISNEYSNCQPTLIDVLKQKDQLCDLVNSVDVVVSLLPISLHLHILKCCIKYKKNMVTASYLSAEMLSLQREVEAAEITVINEVGLDPGIDHALAMQCFDEVKEKGGIIESFISYCGGLPSPECSHNPLRYKFTWSPRDALLNITRAARYIRDYKIVDICSGGSVLDHVDKFDYFAQFELECFANRDSTVYQKRYGLERVKNFIRGTLRYQGYSKALTVLLKLGLLDPALIAVLQQDTPDVTWRELILSKLTINEEQKRDVDVNDLVKMRVGAEGLKIVQDLGLLQLNFVEKFGNLLDTLSIYLSKRLKFELGERDLVILHHEIGINWPEKGHEKRTISLVHYGEADGFSAMAQTVGKTAAIAVKMMLQGAQLSPGFLLPLQKEIYQTILRELAVEGIIARNHSEFS